METNKSSQVSQFCDTLMNVTAAVNNLRRHADCAVVICSDGSTVCSRQCGSYQAALKMVLCKMLNDDSFAELFMEASMLYSRRMGVVGNRRDNEAYGKEEAHGQEVDGK